METSKVKGRQRIPEIDPDAFIAKLNEFGNINRTAIFFQIDPAVIKIQFARNGKKIARRFKIVKNEKLPLVRNIDKKVSGTETLIVGGTTFTVSQLVATLNEYGNISKASIKLGLVDSGVRSCLKNRGYDLITEYVLVPMDQAQPRNKNIPIF
ncbi:hypothetical protein EB093_07165 [bacterium]|nr:hypothetical protein [bacterium]